MNAGHYISGAAHVGLIGWALIGGVFQPTPEPFEVTEVSVVSTAEFESLLAGAQAPETAVDLASLVNPDTSFDQPNPVVEDPAPAAPTLPDPAPIAPPSRPEPQPVPIERPADPAEVTDDVAVLVPPTPPQTPQIESPNVAERPQARPVDRVAPTPVAPPEPDVRIDDIAQDAVENDVGGEEQKPEQDQTAEAEANTEIVTEADKSDVTAAPPKTSLRPKVRPQRPVAQPAPQPENPARDPVADALAEALRQSNAQAPSQPAGPPMTSGENDALRVAVQKCWNTGALSSEALRTTVIVAVSMNKDGTPNTGSIQLVSSQGGSAGSVNQAFQAARRAIIRCGARGFDLPVNKYEQWRDIEMTFNPEKMRIK